VTDSGIGTTRSAGPGDTDRSAASTASNARVAAVRALPTRIVGRVMAAKHVLEAEPLRAAVLKESLRAPFARATSPQRTTRGMRSK